MGKLGSKQEQKKRKEKNYAIKCKAMENQTLFKFGENGKPINKGSKDNKRHERTPSRLELRRIYSNFPLKIGELSYFMSQWGK